jgi:PAS domain S-box-containing protein
MTSRDDRPEQAAELRRRAEEIAREKAAQSPEDLEALSPEETRQTLHELRVHQIELEMQNEELRRAQAALDAARARYFDLYDLAPVGYCTISEKGLILEANLTAATLLGAARSALGKRPITRFILKEDQGLYYLHRKQLLETGEPQAFELRMVKKDETAFWARLEATAAPDADGAPVYRIVLSDITERKRAEEALYREKIFTEALLESIPGILYVYDEDGNFIRWNKKHEEMTGYSAEELTHKTPLSWYEEKDIPRVAKAIEDVFSTGYGEVESNLIIKDGSKLLLHLNGVRLTIYGKTYFTGVGIDITERQRAEAALRQKVEELARSNAELEQFAYVASHDLQEPLRTAGSFAQLLQKRYQGKLDQTGDEFIGYIVDGTQHMQRLINDLLTFARVGTRGKAFEPADCAAVLAQAVAHLQIAIEEGGAVVTHDPLPVLNADSGQLGQLLQNLIGNSIKFHAAARPRIHVSAQRTEEGWVLSVQDNGIGIDPQFADRIFEVFQRLHTRAEYPGTGIGLAVCKKIVERHGGRIWVESAPGKGATFRFTIPS